MAEKSFTVDARTIIHLGRESIKDHTTALIELVKNSYDADANLVEIEIYQKETLDMIRISDDGFGMTEKDIDSSWLRIGFSEKKANKVTPKGRRKTGEKGIGRLSTDRLGEELQITSVSRQDKNSLFDRLESTGIKINWELFNQDNKELSNIKVSTINNPIVNLPKKSTKDTGTELIIAKLRNSWTKENIETLCDELSILNSPFIEVEDFEIYLKNDIAPEFDGKILPPASVLPEIELDLEYDGVSFDICYNIKDRFNEQRTFKGEITWQELSQKIIDPFEYTYSETSLSCGPVRIKLLFYPRTKSLAEGTSFSLSDLREYVDKNAGVKIFRDNVSVKPYGYSNSIVGSDWLGLAERHTRNPAGIGRSDYRLIPNQLVGAVFLSRDFNSNITDSASREGLVENNAFFDLRALVLSSVSLIENHRYTMYQERKQENSIVKSSHSETATKFQQKVEIAKVEIDSLKNLTKDISRANIEKSEENDKVVEIKKAVEKLSKFVEDSEKTSISYIDLLNHNRVLAGLATIGISSAVFGHETQSAISKFKSSAKTAQKYLEITPPDIHISKSELSKSLDAADQIVGWGKFALSRVNKEKREKEVKNIGNIVTGLIDELSRILAQQQVLFIKDNIQEVIAKVYPMDIESILINLLTNSYTASLQNSSDRKIRVEVFSEVHDKQDGFCIIVSNSGPPIDPQFLDWIWEPLNTQKKDSSGRETGTGLGLTIIKSIVDDLKGYKEIDTDNELGGARFKIWLPLK